MSQGFDEGAKVALEVLGEGRVNWSCVLIVLVLGLGGFVYGFRRFCLWV